MLIHVPRVLWTVARGALKPQPLAGLKNAHVYTARVNPLLDIDQFAHMNNASYAVHFEVCSNEHVAASLSLSLAESAHARVLCARSCPFVDGAVGDGSSEWADAKNCEG